MKKRASPFALLGFVAGLAAAPALLDAATELARVNGAVITLEEFNRKYRENLKFFPGKAPPRKGVLDDLVKRELGIQEARKLGLDRDPDVVDRMNTVLYHALIDRKLSKEFEAIHVTDEDAREHYRKYPEIRTSHIFVEVPPGAKPEQEKQALEKLRTIQETQLKDGRKSFAEVAQQFSEGPNAPLGGDVDYQTKDRLDPAYYEAALKLKTPGKVSGIVRTSAGFHIIKLTAIRPWDEVDRPAVKRQAFEERKAQIFERYMAQLRSKAKVTVRESLLKD